MIRSILRLFTGVIYIVVTAVTMAQAHENKPAIIDLRLAEDRAQVTIVLSLEAIMAGTANHTTSGEGDEAGPYQDLRSLAPEAMREVWLAQEPDFRKGINFSIDGVPIDLIPGPVTVPPVGDPRTARDSVVIYEGPIPNNTGDMAWQTDETYGDTVLRLYFGDAAEPAVADLAFAGATATANLSKVAPKTALGVFTAYIFVGFDHIIPKGLDHILFVVGIFLLAARLGPILWQVTMFTAAHTITLALGALGWVTLPATLVEPIIAASIAYVAVENIFTQRLQPWRPALVFGFGLLHGLGFASVLGDFGLPDGQFLPALLGFNMGVELGQIVVILACFLAVGFWFRDRPWYHRGIVIPASAAIAAVSLYWVVERTGLVALQGLI